MIRLLSLFLIVVVGSACVARTQPAPGPGPGREARSDERRDDRLDARYDASSPWDKLGERWVDGQVDRDVIAVSRQDRYSSVKIVVEHSAVEIFDVVVVFGNGDRFPIDSRMVFGQGTTSRTIDLPGNTRFIQRIEFRYGNLPGGGKAQVELWGLGTRRT
jgi:hypothetical protein